MPAATAMFSNQVSPSRATGSITCEPDRATRKDSLDGASAAEDTVAEPSVDETDYYDAVGYAPPTPWQEAHDALQQQIALDNRQSDSKDSTPRNVFADIGLNHDSWIQSVLPPGVYATSMNFASSVDGGMMTPQQRQQHFAALYRQRLQLMQRHQAREMSQQIRAQLQAMARRVYTAYHSDTNLPSSMASQAVSSGQSSASGLEHNASPSNIPTIKICSLIYLLLQLVPTNLALDTPHLTSGLNF